jgi:hypothetical protein
MKKNKEKTNAIGNLAQMRTKKSQSWHHLKQNPSMPIVKSNNMQNANEESLLPALFFNMLGADFGFIRSSTYQSQNTKP